MSRHVFVVGILSAGAFVCGVTLAGQVPLRDTGAINVAPVQRVPIGTGVISGVVTSAATGSPIRRAQIRLSGTSDVINAEVARGRVGGRSAEFGTPGVRGGAGAAPQVAGTVAQLAASGSGATGGRGLPLNRIAVADAQGKFVFQNLPSGRFTLSVSRDQFLPLNYGEKKYGRPGTPIAVADGQRLEVQLRMTRMGSISGLVTGEDGEPQTRAQVRALMYTRTNGFKRLVVGATVQSDDRGMFRLFGLSPGEYVIGATPNPVDLQALDRAASEIADLDRAIADAPARAGVGPATPGTRMVTLPARQLAPQDGPPAGYLPTYYPSSATPATASTVPLGAGEDRDSVNVQVQTIRAANVTGTIVGFNGQPGTVVVMARPEDPLADTSTSLTSSANADGKFVIRNLPPGRYELFAQTVPRPQPPPPSLVGGANGLLQAAPVEIPKLWGRTDVIVDGQSAPNVIIQLASGRSISGQIVFDGNQADLPRGRIGVTLIPAPAAAPVSMFGPTPQAQVGEDGRFLLADILPGRYIIRAPGAKSAVVNGQDTMDFPLEFNGDRDITGVVVTLGNQPTMLSGTLTDASGSPTSEYTIIVAATDTRFWTPGSRRVQVSRPGPTGEYRFAGLPPGTYMLAAVTDIEPGAQYDPEFLRELAAASASVTIVDGAQQSQNIRLAR